MRSNSDRANHTPIVHSDNVDGTKGAGFEAKWTELEMPTHRIESPVNRTALVYLPQQVTLSLLESVSACDHTTVAT